MPVLHREESLLHPLLDRNAIGASGCSDGAAILASRGTTTTRGTGQTDVGDSPGSRVHQIVEAEFDSSRQIGQLSPILGLLPRIRPRPSLLHGDEKTTSCGSEGWMDSDKVRPVLKDFLDDMMLGRDPDVLEEIGGAQGVADLIAQAVGECFDGSSLLIADGCKRITDCSTLCLFASMRIGVSVCLLVQILMKSRMLCAPSPKGTDSHV